MLFFHSPPTLTTVDTESTTANMRTPSFSASCAVICLLGHAAARPEVRRVKTDHGAVASEVDACSHVGVDLMRKGGNAADAVSSARYWFTAISPVNDL